MVEKNGKIMKKADILGVGRFWSGKAVFRKKKMDSRKRSVFAFFPAEPISENFFFFFFGKRVFGPD
jgi:hypothetical protein